MSAPQDEPLPRGVWRLPYLDEQGQRLLIAIDSRGRQVAPPTRDNPGGLERLLRVLSERDPLPADARPAAHDGRRRGVVGWEGSLEEAVERELDGIGSAHRAPEEPSFWCLSYFNGERSRRLPEMHKVRRRIHTNWPRRCCDCGDYFTGHATRLRCLPCHSAHKNRAGGAKSKREGSQGGQKR